MVLQQVEASDQIAVVLQKVEAAEQIKWGGSSVRDATEGSKWKQQGRHTSAATVCQQRTKDDAMVLLQQVEPVEMVQWHCNKWNSKQQRRCSGAAIAKSSRVDPMVLQQVETTEKM